ncbi:MAG: cyclic nucleotide-binding domain-containing protein [Verrucomicrobiota bacterium]
MESFFKNNPALMTFQKIPLFQKLSQDSLLTLYIASKETIVQKDDCIVSEGTAGDELYIIGRGKVDVFKDYGQSNQVHLSTLGHNACFGEMCIIEPIVRSASVVAAETSILYSITCNSLNKLYQIWPDQHTQIMKNLCTNLTERIATMDKSFLMRAC